MRSIANPKFIPLNKSSIKHPPKELVDKAKISVGEAPRVANAFDKSSLDTLPFLIYDLNPSIT